MDYLNLKIISFLFLIQPLYASDIDTNCSTFVYQGAPTSELVENTQYICKLNYAIHYRFDTKTPEYVVEHVTKEAIAGPTPRSNDFHVDKDIDPKYTSRLIDYAVSKYERGHLSPADDNTQTEEIMYESFSLSNMVPQNPNNNKGIWKNLETLIRTWVNEGKDLYVITGTIYNKKFKTIGPDKVGVPPKLFKVIIDKNTNNTIGFIIPNKNIPSDKLMNLVVSVDTVEKLTKINFFPLLDEKYEKTFDLNFWSQK